jgi:site-specific DNA-cytosine methylase
MIALERAGIPVSEYSAYEIDEYAIHISQKNYPQIKQCGDVTTADFTQYKGDDLLIGGSPCQGFSFAGKQLNFDDPRSKLFFEYVRALNEAEPKYFLFENTPMRKEYVDVITEHLGVEPIMINSKLVSAQNRNRMYWTNIPGVEQPKDRGILLQDILEYGITQRKKSKTVRTGGIGSGWGDKHEWDMPNPERRYTMAELERLQTLPDCYTEGISDNKRIKCIGNGWTVDVIAHILSHIKKDRNIKKDRR